MSLLTDALTKPDAPKDDTAESAITELKEELNISGDLDESSRDPTVQALALDELMLEEFEAARQQREDDLASKSNQPDEPASEYSQTDVLSEQDVIAAQSIVLEELPEPDIESPPLEILHEPPTLTNDNAGPDPARVIMPETGAAESKSRRRPGKLMSLSLLIAGVLVTFLLYFILRPADDSFDAPVAQIDNPAVMEPATLSSLPTTRAAAEATTPASKPEDGTVAPSDAPKVQVEKVGPPVNAANEFVREPATVEDVRGFAAAAERAAETQPEQTATIEIARSRTQSPVYSLLKDAYTEFQAGDFVAASMLYQETLVLDPNSVDALLGLAAIAQRNNALTEAQSYYRMALSLDPKNSLAIAGMMSLKKSFATVENESELKSMLAEQPRAAHLHFALGLHYVSQSRWPDAQQAFFEAVRHDSTNADYAFNLAVSLDQLGQRNPAAGFYERSLQLATGSHQFDPEQAKKRLSTLTGK